MLRWEFYIITVISIAYVTTNFIFLVMRYNIDPLRFRRKFILFMGFFFCSIYIFVNIIFTYGNFDEYKLCGIAYISKTTIEATITTFYLIRIVQLWVMHKKQSITDKTRRGYLWVILSPLTTTLASLSLILVICMYTFLFPIRNPVMMWSPLKDCHFIPVYEIIVGIIAWCIIFVVCWMIRYKSDEYYLKFEFYGCSGTEIVVIILYAVIYATKKYEIAKTMLQCQIFFQIFFSYLFPCLMTFKSKSLNRQEISESNVKLDTVLQSNNLKKNFRNHLKKEFSVENLDFYDEVMNFEETWDTSTPVERQNNCIRIYQLYVRENSLFQVNLSCENVKKIWQKIDMMFISKYMFEEAKKEIVNLMRTDSFPRFLKKINI